MVDFNGQLFHTDGFQRGVKAVSWISIGCSCSLVESNSLPWQMVDLNGYYGSLMALSREFWQFGGFQFGFVAVRWISTACC